MGTDFLTVKYKDNELRRKYKNFFVPAAKVLIGDNRDNLSEKYQVQVESIQISLNLEDAASASFTVTNIYDLKSHSIKSSVKKALSLGNIVKIKLGYDSELETVFQGFIYERSVQFSDIPSMQVTAMDVKRLMIDNYRENYTWDKTKHSEIFQEIMKDYEKMKLKVQVDNTTTVIEKNSIVQKGNDLQMVKKLCKAANRKFIVCGGKAYFTEKNEKEPMTPLLWGQDLISFSQRASYVDVNIEVWGNKKGESEKKVEKRSVTSSTDMKRVRQKSTTNVIVMPDVDSLDELKNRADEAEESMKERIQSGSGSCVGIPVMIPGRYIEIKGLDDDINGKYYLKSVSHNFGGDGYTTEFTLGGRK